MDEFSANSGDFVEFVPYLKESVSFLESYTETEPDAQRISRLTQTTSTNNVSVQTVDWLAERQPCDDQLLAVCLKKMYPLVACELFDGVTPMYSPSEIGALDVSINPYQQISHESSIQQLESKGVAVWLSNRLDNIPALAISTSPPHQGWCEHFEQKLSLHVPKRNQQFVTFVEADSTPVKACLQILLANVYDRSIFVGVTIANDFYVWKHEVVNNSDVISEIAYKALSAASVIAIDWLQLDEILTAHVDGNLYAWNVCGTIVLNKR